MGWNLVKHRDSYTLPTDGYGKLGRGLLQTLFNMYVKILRTAVRVPDIQYEFIMNNFMFMSSGICIRHADSVWINYRRLKSSCTTYLVRLPRQNNPYLPPWFRVFKSCFLNMHDKERRGVTKKSQERIVPRACKILQLPWRIVIVVSRTETVLGVSKLYHIYTNSAILTQTMPDLHMLCHTYTDCAILTQTMPDVHTYCATRTQTVPYLHKLCHTYTHAVPHGHRWCHTYTNYARHTQTVLDALKFCYTYRNSQWKSQISLFSCRGLKSCDTV